MSRHAMVATIGALAVIMTGCGGDKPAQSNGSSSSTTSEAPLAPLNDPDACTELTGADIDLSLATTAEDAQMAAGIFAKYNPPASVKAAIDHFVETEGPQLADSKYDEYDKTIIAWVHQLCPS